MTTQYIVAHDFGLGDKYYLQVVDNITVNELRHPGYATAWPSRKAAKKWVQQYAPMAEHCKVLPLGTELTAFLKSLETGLVRRTFKCIDNNFSRPYNGESLAEVIEWRLECALRNDFEVRYEDYKTWPDLYQISRHLWSVGKYAYTTDKDVSVIGFEVYTRQDDKFEDFKQELNLVIPKVTRTLENNPDVLVFDVLDHYLSEHGNSVNLLYNPRTGKATVEHRRSYFREPELNMTLEEAFEYLRRERYYE